MVPIEGFLVVDKPSGPTSHDVVAAVRRAVGIKKVGHAGTLDPMATGAVVVGIGRSTRLIRFVQELPKVYIADVRFGIATDSLDATGTEVERMTMEFGRSELEEAAAGFTGEIQQVPPMVSALKRDGVRLYELARQGIEVEREARPVVVHSIEVLSFTPGEFPAARLFVECGKGTYIRSLADDIARELGGRAHLEGLRRLRVGKLDVESRGIPMAGLDDWQSSLIAPGDALADLPLVPADDPAAVRSGRRIPVDGVADAAAVRIVDGEGTLLAVYSVSDQVGKAEVVLS